MTAPTLTAFAAPEGEQASRGVVTRAAGEGPREAGIDGDCESSHEADSRRNDSLGTSKEADARRRSMSTERAADFAALFASGFA